MISKRAVHYLLLAELLIGALFAGMILVGFVVGETLEPRSLPQRRVAADLSDLSWAVTEYSIKHLGRYPESLEALLVPDEGGRTASDLRSLPRDPWGGEYGYVSDDEWGYRLVCYGADGMPGGLGDAADIDQVDLWRASEPPFPIPPVGAATGLVFLLSSYLTGRNRGRLRLLFLVPPVLMLAVQVVWPIVGAPLPWLLHGAWTTGGAFAFALGFCLGESAQRLADGTPATLAEAGAR